MAAGVGIGGVDCGARNGGAMAAAALAVITACRSRVAGVVAEQGVRLLSGGNREREGSCTRAKQGEEREAALPGEQPNR
eukprot:322031-Chlamydomonas_euryale.AAC.1